MASAVLSEASSSLKYDRMVASTSDGQPRRHGKAGDIVTMRSFSHEIARRIYFDAHWKTAAMPISMLGLDWLLIS